MHLRNTARLLIAVAVALVAGFSILGFCSWFASGAAVARLLVGCCLGSTILVGFLFFTGRPRTVIDRHMLFTAFLALLTSACWGLASVFGNAFGGQMLLFGFVCGIAATLIALFGDLDRQNHPMAVMAIYAVEMAVFSFAVRSVF